jgi:hypothetical protein
MLGSKYVGLKPTFILIYFSKLEVEVVHEVEEPPNIGLKPPKPRCPFLLLILLKVLGE